MRKGLALTHQIVRPFREMTVLDNVVLAAGYRRTANPLRALLHVERRRETERAAEILLRVGLAGNRGQARRFAAARPNEAARSRARAGARSESRSCSTSRWPASTRPKQLAQIETIAAVHAQGITVVLVEHNLEEVMRSCRRLIVINEGRVIGDGAPEAVMADPDVRKLTSAAGEGPCWALSTSTAATARCARCTMCHSMCRPASMFALLGPNGAGKTSTIMAIMGHVNIYRRPHPARCRGYHTTPRR